MPKNTITTEEWLTELSKLGMIIDDQSAMTTRELAAATGKGIDWVRIQLRRAKNDVVLISTQKMVVSIDCKMRMAQAYKISPRKKARGK